MKIALHNADKTNYPNLPLMKLSAYHKAQGDQVSWYIPLMKGYYDLVYSSKVFSFESNDILLPNATIKGGTGYNSDSVLPQEIEHIMPDYSLYPAFKASLGFTTRGCICNCPWCVVPKKEGNIKAHADIEEFIRSDSNETILMDNNILAHEHGIKQLEKSIALGLRIDCNQGLDARLIAEDVSLGRLLAKVKWLRFIRLACDTLEQIPAIEKAVKAIRQYKANQEIACYVLVKDIPTALERVKILRKLEVKPFVQPYRPLGKEEMPDKIEDQLCYFEGDSDGGFYVPIKALTLVDGNLAEYIAAANPKTVLELIAEIERLEKEADWLAKNCQGEDQCPYLANYRDLKGDIRPKWCDCLDNGEEFDCDEYAPDCWRNAAREAVEKGE